jgi:hypothetical protein
MMIEREPFVFGKGWVHSRDLMYFYGATRQMSAADEFESVVLRWNGGEWGLWQVPTRMCSVVTSGRDDARTVFCTGIDGYVEVSEATGVHLESIDDAADGPDGLKHITFVRPIGERLFAVGMSRMVYVRDPMARAWSRADDGIRISRLSPEIDGLKSIDGNARQDLVAVALRGGIWVQTEGRWRGVDSPTNVKLESVRWIDDVLYVAGGAGLLLRGRPDALKAVHHHGPQETFWSIESYHGELYLATRSGSIWKLVGDDLHRIDLPGRARATTGWLHANDDMLLSVGERDLLVYNGIEWQRLEPPPPETPWPFEW